MASGTRPRVALLDDYQGVALASADWSAVDGRTEITVFRDHLADEDALDACLFMGPLAERLDWDAVKAVFAANTISDQQRRLLLSGKSADGVSSDGPVVCACFGVGRTAICGVIAEGACTPADIGAKLRAGTNCGSCIPELKRLIAQTEVREPLAASAAS